MKQFILSLVLIATLFVQSSFSQTFSVQGVLRDPNGKSVSDGTYQVTFKLYTVTSGGSPIWTETVPQVTVTKGVFSVELGTVTSLSSLAFNAQYYLGITVATGTELTPRMKITPSVSSLSVQGFSNVVPSTGNVGIGTLNPLNKLDVNGNIKLNDLLMLTHGEPPGIDAFGDATTGAWLRFNGGDFVISNKNSDMVYGYNGKANMSHWFSTNIGGAVLQISGNASGDVILKNHYNSGTAITLGGDGTVGIEGRITNPQHRLDVDGNIKLNDLLMLTHGEPPGIDASGDATRGAWLRFGGGDFVISNKNSDMVYGFNGKANMSHWFCTNIGGAVLQISGNASGDVLLSNYYHSGTTINLGGNGTIYGNFAVGSDRRLKKDIVPINNALERITKLSGYTFNWRDDVKDVDIPLGKGHDYGFIAQEILDVFPEMVSKSGAGYYGVAYTKMIPVLLEAIKEQQTTIESLQKENADVKLANADLKQRLERVEGIILSLGLDSKNSSSTQVGLNATVKSEK